MTFFRVDIPANHSGISILYPSQIKDMRAKVATIDLKTRINDVTKGLIKSYSKRLEDLSPKYASVICDYIFALRSEIKLSNGYKKNIINTLILLSVVGKGKDFGKFTRADVITFMNRFRKEDSEDPTHKWIGTYNANLINVCKFFKWLYFTNVEAKKRPKPAVIENLPKMRRMEISGYEPSDMWDAEDNLIFLKYCPYARDRCFHAMETDVAARPHELLNLKIKDVEFKDGTNGRYAQIVVNGKTGQRPLPLIDSIPYVTQWLSEHPQRDNVEAPLLPNLQTGGTIQVGSIYKAYLHYKKYFTDLLSKDIPEEDKKRLRKLLKKPFNPYVHRHSALTEKSRILSSDSKLRQYAGWSITSQMNRRYVHFKGGEATNDLLIAKGVISKDPQSVNLLSPKLCPNPNCREQNKPDARFCFKCSLILSFEDYQQELVEKDRKEQEFLELKAALQKESNEVQHMRKELNKIINITYKLFGELKRGKGLTDDEIPRLTEHEYMRIDHI